MAQTDDEKKKLKKYLKSSFCIKSMIFKVVDTLRVIIKTVVEFQNVLGKI